MQTGRSDIIHKLRNNADNIFGLHQQNSTFHVQSFGRSHKQSSFYTQTRYVKGLFLVQRRSGENFR